MRNYEFERYVNFEFYKTSEELKMRNYEFERYVNFEFYKTNFRYRISATCLRDM